MITLKAPLILASQSPRRKALLSDLGIPFQTLVRPVKEFFPEGHSPQEAAVFLAQLKANAYRDLSPTHIILTADTIVAAADHILGKPGTPEEARDMLELLSGKTHLVTTGVALFHQNDRHSFAVDTQVTFRELQPREIRYYIEQFQPYDKAGAYGIQEWIGMIGISEIQGDFYNVMGLPLYRLFLSLKAYEISPASP